MNTQSSKSRAPSAMPTCGQLFPHDVFTVPEAAKRLGIGESSAWVLIRAGKLKTTKFGPRTTRITGQNLIDFIESSE